ncbi:MAG: efflux RND transporter periplasmic adaptor subunit [Tannerella sp.]|jgi:RND family efflux transporter MFP subunit|nr:efflux RND transporter periplasmic adaptor subunit [Tannerella sp.]
MKRHIICIFIAAAAITGGCRNEKEQAHATGDGHEHFEGDGHAHAACNHGDEAAETDTDGIRFSAVQAEAAGLEIQAVVPGTFHQVIKTGGQIQATQGDEVTLAATGSGIVSFVNPSITDGAAVRAGEAVVTVSAKNLQDGDRAALARINYETELKAYQRAETLVKDDIISAKEFEQIRQRYETARTVYEAQAANVTAQGVTVRTPVGGFIKNRLVGQGEYVSVGQPIVTVSKNRRLQLRAEVSEKYYRALAGVRTAHFRMAYGDTLYKMQDLNGRLLSFGKSSGQSSFYVPVTFEFDNTGDILPGAFAEVYLLTEPRNDVITVPVSAVTEEQGLYFVYLQTGEEIYRKQEVTPGQDNGENIQVVAGLQAGDKVVVRGVCQVKQAAGAGAVPEGHSHSH